MENLLKPNNSSKTNNIMKTLKNHATAFVVMLLTAITLTSCAEESFHYPDGFISLDVTHEHNFSFSEGDELLVYTNRVEYEGEYIESEDYILVARLKYNLKSGKFIGDGELEKGQPIKVVYTNNREGINAVVNIPTAQSYNSPLPLIGYSQYGDKKPIELDLYDNLCILRTPISKTTGVVEISTNHTISGHWMIDFNMFSGIYKRDTIIYTVSELDAILGYVDIVIPIGKYEKMTIALYDSSGSGSTTYNTTNELIRGINLAF